MSLYAVAPAMNCWTWGSRKRKLPGKTVCLPIARVSNQMRPPVHSSNTTRNHWLHMLLSEKLIPCTWDVPENALLKRVQIKLQFSVHWKSHKGMCRQFPQRSGFLSSDVATSQVTCDLRFMMDGLPTSFSVKSEMSNFLTACTYLPEPSPMQERKYSKMIHRHLANGQQQMINRPCEKKPTV